ncbi:CvpA family protein [Saccharibacter floricola]|uniref:CvpA family protein n=1 Tax=Saccharibacter floricola TaxID=231053 RepID=UPI00036AC9E9|nr:CvpA family protein [Saccharibacter floricola]
MTGGDNGAAAIAPIAHHIQSLGAADGVLLAVLGLSMLVGLWRGFSRETGNVLVWAGAIWLTIRFNADVIAMIERNVAPNLGDNPLFVWGGRGVFFILTLACLQLISQQVIRLTRHALSRGIDAVFGAVFGIIRGYVLLVVFFMAIGWVAPNWLGTLVQGSLGAPYVMRGVGAVEAYMPSSMRQDLAFGTTSSH